MGAQLTGQARSWRRLAVAAAGTAALLTVRVLASRGVPPAGAARRLTACESHLEELDRRVNALNIWAGEHWHRREPSARADFTPGDVYNRLDGISGGDDGG